MGNAKIFDAVESIVPKAKPVETSNASPMSVTKPNAAMDKHA